MKIGYFVPQMGKAANAENIKKVAQEAEKQGFDSVWVTDRLLYSCSCSCSCSCSRRSMPTSGGGRSPP